MMFVLYDSLTDDACEHSKKEHKQNFANHAKLRCKVTVQQQPISPHLNYSNCDNLTGDNLGRSQPLAPEKWKG